MVAVVKCTALHSTDTDTERAGFDLVIRRRCRCAAPMGISRNLYFQASGALYRQCSAPSSLRSHFPHHGRQQHAAAGRFVGLAEFVPSFLPPLLPSFVRSMVPTVPRVFLPSRRCCLDQKCRRSSGAADDDDDDDDGGVGGGVRGGLLRRGTLNACLRLGSRLVGSVRSLLLLDS